MNEHVWLFLEPARQTVKALREHIVDYLLNRGLQCAVNQVAVINGAQQALDLVGRVLIDPGDTVVMEQPGYFGAANVFLAAEANIRTVGLDEEGMRTDELASLLRRHRVKLIYVTPAAQSPTGVVSPHNKKTRPIQCNGNVQRMSKVLQQFKRK